MDTHSPGAQAQAEVAEASAPAPTEALEAPADVETPKAGTPISVDAAASPAPAAVPAPAEEPATKAPELTLEEQATKKRKLAVLQDENKKRGKRMFGLLQSTLKQAKCAGENVSGAAAKRKELEERLAKKLKGEKEEMEKKGMVAREAKELKLSVVKKEEEIGRTEAIVSSRPRLFAELFWSSRAKTRILTQYAVRHATKLRLANFLCTSFTLPPPPPASDDISVAFAPRLPHALRVANPTAPKPIYYRPYKLLRSQEDQIENQIAGVKSAIRKEKESWEDAKGEKIDELEQAKRKRDAQREEAERDEREARQKKRREAEEKEDQERRNSTSGAGADVVGDVEMRSKAEVVREADAEDVAMASAPVFEEDTPASNGAAKDDKMEVGEEDLEY